MGKFENKNYDNNLSNARQNKLIKFLLFIFIQIITSTVVIILFQQTFHLKPIIINYEYPTNKFT